MKLEFPSGWKMNEREDGDGEEREREQWIVYNYLFSAIWNAINKQI